jgi:tripartite ATP-independent transporter DctM subunit
MIATSILVLMFLLLALGAPIGFTLIVSGATGVLWVGGLSATLGVLSAAPHELAGKYEFLTIPMFLLMAEFVLRSGVADDLFRTAAAWCGRVPGGLGMATAMAGAGFGAICGSSTASAATLSATSLPSMLKHGYEPRMASGVVAISGTLAMLIPPSIAMVLYGLLADVNIAELLIAGIIPAVVVTAAIILTTYYLAIRDPKCAPMSPKVSMAEKFKLLRLVLPMLVLMLAVTGIIYTGIATPTEASAFGAVTAGVLYFARGRRTRAEVFDLFSRAARTSCMLAIIILGAYMFSTFFALTQTTQSLIAWVGALPVPSWVIICILILGYLILGCFMDQTSILVLTTPVIAPLVASMGYSLIWFGVIKIVTAELGMVLPPFGLNCFVVSKYSKMPVEEVFKGIMPHVLAHFVALAILLLFPVLSLWLPNHMR